MPGDRLRRQPHPGQRREVRPVHGPGGRGGGQAGRWPADGAARRRGLHAVRAGHRAVRQRLRRGRAAALPVRTAVGQALLRAVTAAAADRGHRGDPRHLRRQQLVRDRRRPALAADHQVRPGVGLPRVGRRQPGGGCCATSRSARRPAPGSASSPSRPPAPAAPPSSTRSPASQGPPPTCATAASRSSGPSQAVDAAASAAPPCRWRTG